MYTLVDLTPPPVRLFQTGGGECNWRKSGRCIVRDNSPQLSCGRLTTDDWEEGARESFDRLFLESPTISSDSDIVDTGTSEKKKKPYIPKNYHRKPIKIFGKLY
jgi:hypothetical protein